MQGQVRGVRAEEITTVIDVGESARVRLQGIRCHATQLGRDNRFSEAPDQVMQDRWFRQEHYVLARSTVSWPEGLERDLFRGLR